jgi:hypothetical protein
MRLLNSFCGCVALASFQLGGASSLETRDADNLGESQKPFVVGGAVKTTSGTVIGHAAGKRPAVSEYLGIRYAQAPVGDLRFAAPKKYTSNDTFIAAAYVRFSCPVLFNTIVLISLVAVSFSHHRAHATSKLT